MKIDTDSVKTPEPFNKVGSTGADPVRGFKPHIENGTLARNQLEASRVPGAGRNFNREGYAPNVANSVPRDIMSRNPGKVR